MASSSGDGENRPSRGDARDFRRSSRISRASLKEDYNQLDEYGKLVKYVSTFQAGEDELEDGDYEEQRIWYAPWKKRWVPSRPKASAQQFPDEWLLTDVRQGPNAF